MNKVLIVDDNLNSSKLAQYILTSFKMQSEIANDGEEALYFFINDNPTTTILDLSMPKLGGLDALMLADQVLAKIRNSSDQRKMNIIFYTTTSYEDLVFPIAKNFRIIGYVSKDWTIDYQKKRFKQIFSKGKA